MCQIQCCMMGNLKKIYFSISMCEVYTTWYWRTDVPVYFMGENCLFVSGRRSDLELLRLVKPSAHSSTRLKNSLVTGTQFILVISFIWKKEEAEWRKLFRGKGAVSAWCVVFDLSAYSFTHSSTEFFLHNSHWANPRIVKVNKTNPHCQGICNPVFASPPHP